MFPKCTDVIVQMGIKIETYDSLWSFGTKRNCRMCEKGREGDVKVFYSHLKHPLGVPPTHIHVYGVFMAKTSSITWYILHFYFHPPLEQFWGTLELFDMKPVRRAECLKVDHVWMWRPVMTFSFEFTAVIGLRNWIHSPTLCCSLSLECTWTHPQFLSKWGTIHLAEHLLGSGFIWCFRRSKSAIFR
jgi:hypothetical protein